MLETLGHYKILGRIGAGGIGEVYRARDTRLGRTVAIKVVSPAALRDGAERRRLLDDARAAATLSHPNVAAFYEAGEDQGVLYLVSEFVPGDTLRTVISGRPINPRRAVDLASQIADGLAQAHAHGIAHGDIRAENVIVTPKGSAKIMEPAFAAWVGEGARPGTLTQATGNDLVDLGVLLFEMLTGVPPSHGPAGATGVPAPSSLNRALPAEMDAIVDRMVATDAAASFSSAATLAAELRALAASLDAKKRDDAPIPAPIVQRRGSNLGWLVALLALVVVVALVWLAMNAE